jgi:hypothetical protein
MDNFVTDTITTDSFIESPNYTYNSKKKVNIQQLIHHISKLNLKEKEHILKLFIDKKIEYTKNVNGYFFNLCSNNVTDEILELVEQGINLMEKNRNLLNDIDKKRDLMLKECKESIENELNNTIKLKKEEYYKKIKNIDVDTNIHYTFERIKRKVFSKMSDYNIDNFDKKTLFYNKNGVYFRINNIMKLLIRKNKTTNIEYYDYSGYDDNNDDNLEHEYIDNNCDEIDEIADDPDSVRAWANQDNMEMYDDGVIDYQIIDNETTVIDNDKNNNLDPDQEIDINDINIDDVVDTDDIDIDIVDTDDVVDDKEKLFYKQLLNKHGFSFNEDKICFLLYQKYLL